ncbi:hypothetical protein J3F83DRAFT_747403 [Trichoderma novae-zelandiae]
MSFLLYVLVRLALPGERAGDASPPQPEAEEEANRRLEKMPQRVELCCYPYSSVFRMSTRKYGVDGGEIRLQLQLQLRHPLCRSLQ